MSRPRLSDRELSFFKTFGYLVLRNCLTPRELTAINAEFDHAMAAQHPEGYDGAHRHNALLMDEDTPTFARLIEDPRLLEPAKQMYGDDVLGMNVDGNRYVGDTGWHPDTRSALQYGVKFAIYLQPVRADSGALRVIPATHLACPSSQEFIDGVRQRAIAEVPASALESDPGDVVAFDLRLWHGSCGGKADRRMCTVVYYANPTTPEGVEALRLQGEQNVKNLRAAGGATPARPFKYSQRWLANPDHSPVRQRWIDRLSSIGYYDAPGLVERPEATAR